MKKAGLFLTMIFFAQIIFGQYQIGIIPRVSPDKAIYQKIGYTEVEIRYGSPSVSSRNIWGDLVPYDQVWRAGANAATTIEFSAAVNIGTTTLDSGKYAFFVIPKEDDKWTIVFNKTSKQWGAFRYDQKEDALRVEVRPRTTNYKTENLSYSIEQTGFKYGSINLSWDFVTLEIPFATNYLTEFELEIESRADAQPEYIKWIPYIQGAEHLEQINSSIELAKKWINRAEEIMNNTQEWNDQFYPRPYVTGHLYWTKAKIMAWDNNYAAAVEYVDQLKSMETASFYEKKNETAEIDLHYEAWKEKLMR